MSSLILRGKDVTVGLKERINEQLQTLDSKPNLAIVRVGDDPSQMSYEKSCIKIMGNLGIETECFTFDEKIEQKEFDKEFKSINDSKNVHSILMLKPLPQHLSDAYVNDIIDPAKDVDCIGTQNMAKLYQDDYSRFGPCTAEACLAILDSMDFDYKGKKVTMVGFGMVIGKPLTLLLINKGATVTVCHEFTKDLAAETKEADVIVVATGVMGLINERNINPNAVIIDVGINVNKEGKICGDVDYEGVVDKVKAITPVPGGVGTVTNTILASHVVRSYEILNEK